jgi:phosphate transport system substrate-binding protein
MTTRQKDEETEKGVKATEIAKDGIAVIVNNDNDLEELSSDQVKSIYTGETYTWDEVTE